jgi:hypothetical protein
MDKTFHATYEQGVLRLDAPLSLPEQTRVVGLVVGVDAPTGEPPQASATNLADDEFERLLDEFSVHGGNSLPADFSRADLYLDHD